MPDGELVGVVGVVVVAVVVAVPAQEVGVARASALDQHAKGQDEG